ncbi:MAG: Por secretion system protein, partial [Bacteroidetes bacterium HGW-Bacteroidetes-23]
LQFNIYPNPVSEELYIVHGYNEVDYNLFSVDGKLVQNGLLQGLKINVSNLQSGLYILQLEVDGKKEIKKIVKK